MSNIPVSVHHPDFGLVQPLHLRQTRAKRKAQRLFNFICMQPACCACSYYEERGVVIMLYKTL